MVRDSKNTKPDAEGATEDQTARRAYVPPAIRREEVFETVAAGCTQFTKASCGVGFTAS